MDRWLFGWEPFWNVAYRSQIYVISAVKHPSFDCWLSFSLFPSTGCLLAMSYSPAINKACRCHLHYLIIMPHWLTWPGLTLSELFRICFFHPLQHFLCSLTTVLDRIRRHQQHPHPWWYWGPAYKCWRSLWPQSARNSDWMIHLWFFLWLSPSQMPAYNQFHLLHMLSEKGWAHWMQQNLWDQTTALHTRKKRVCHQAYSV